MRKVVVGFVLARVKLVCLSGLHPFGYLWLFVENFTKRGLSALLLDRLSLLRVGPTKATNIIMCQSYKVRRAHSKNICSTFYIIKLALIYVIVS